MLSSRQKSILENIKISNAILSRFDLVFLLLDDPDLQKDKKLSEHVMKLHSRNRKRKYDQISSSDRDLLSVSLDESISYMSEPAKNAKRIKQNISSCSMNESNFIDILSQGEIPPLFTTMY